MQNLRSLLAELKQESDQNKIMSKLPMLTDTINGLLSKIQHCNNIEFATNYFSLLEEIHSCVCIMAFVKEIEVSDQLWKFLKDFDRIDDKEWREYIFKRIKNHTYTLEGIPALDEPCYK